MNARRITHQMTGFLFILSAVFFVLGSPPAAYAVNTGEVIVLESQVVCSPGAHKTCLPGPFTETVEVPEGATGGQVDAYWLWWGTPGQVQPNEHSWFHLSVNGSHVDSIYCPDFGDVIPGEHFCGSVSFQAEAGDALALTIVHADEERGRTPGSHQQRWYITWSISQVTPPAPIVTDTPTATPAVEETPPPALTPTETPTPTATITEMPAVTPTPGDAATPTATPEGPEPAGTPAVPAPTTIATLPPPQPPAGTQPAQIIPITGGDLAPRDAQVGLFLRALGGAGLAIVGLALVVMGIRRKYG